MKKCPTCDKTFEDSMRFCQVDGTPLVDDVPFDPYATIVSSSPIPTPVAEPDDKSSVEPETEAAPFEPEKVETPIAAPDDVLDLPSPDPLKTMYVSEAEIRDAMGSVGQAVDEPAGEMPSVNEPDASQLQDAEETAVPELPSFSVPDVPSPSFGEPAPPPSPFSISDSVSDDATVSSTTPDRPVVAPSEYEEPAPGFDEAATIFQQPVSTPFDPPVPAPVAEWTPPPAPDVSWQNQEIDSNTQFQPPPAGTGSVNQVLPIVSLVLGIISLCCYISPITGLAALITGYLGMKNVNNDPVNYGGKGLAIAGMIMGGIMMLVGVAYYVVVILAYAGIIAGSILQGR